MTRLADLVRTFQAFADSLGAFANREARITAEMSHKLGDYTRVMGGAIELLIAGGRPKGQGAA
jgi:hypothetical protein